MGEDTKSGASQKSVVLRLKLKYDSISTFLDRFSPNIGRSGIFLHSKTPRPVGTEIRFELLLANDEPMIVGVGVVKDVMGPGTAYPERPSGMLLEFSKVTRQSREVILKVIARRAELGLSDSEGGLPLPGETTTTGIAPIPPPSPPSRGATPVVAPPPPATTPPRVKPVSAPPPVVSAAAAGESAPSTAAEADVDMAQAMARARSLVAGGIDDELAQVARGTAPGVPTPVSAAEASARLASLLGVVPPPRAERTGRTRAIASASATTPTAAEPPVPRSEPTVSRSEPAVPRPEPAPVLEPTSITATTSITTTTTVTAPPPSEVAPPSLGEVAGPVVEPTSVTAAPPGIDEGSASTTRKSRKVSRTRRKSTRPPPTTPRPPTDPSAGAAATIDSPITLDPEIDLSVPAPAHVPPAASDTSANFSTEPTVTLSGAQAKGQPAAGPATRSPEAIAAEPDIDSMLDAFGPQEVPAAPAPSPAAGETSDEEKVWPGETTASAQAPPFVDFPQSPPITPWPAESTASSQATPWPDGRTPWTRMIEQTGPAMVAPDPPEGDPSARLSSGHIIEGRPLRDEEISSDSSVSIVRKAAAEKAAIRGAGVYSRRGTHSDNVDPPSVRPRARAVSTNPPGATVSPPRAFDTFDESSATEHRTPVPERVKAAADISAVIDDVFSESQASPTTSEARPLRLQDQASRARSAGKRHKDDVVTAAHLGLPERPRSTFDDEVTGLKHRERTDDGADIYIPIETVPLENPELLAADGVAKKRKTDSLFSAIPPLDGSSDGTDFANSPDTPTPFARTPFEQAPSAPRRATTNHEYPPQRTPAPVLKDPEMDPMLDVLSLDLEGDAPAPPVEARPPPQRTTRRRVAAPPPPKPPRARRHPHAADDDIPINLEDEDDGVPINIDPDPVDVDFDD
jgi:hypothetical protein